MQAKRSQLQFTGYQVKELHFEPKLQLNEEEKVIEYSPFFERNIRQVGETDYTLRLTVSIGEKDEIPFIARVSIEGHFSMENVPNPQESMKINATAILFPYLRASLTQLTALANLPPLVIPTYNIVDMFTAKDLEDQAKVLEDQLPKKCLSSKKAKIGKDN